MSIQQPLLEFFYYKLRKIKQNPRLAIVNKQIRDMDPTLVKDIKLQAKKLIKNIEDV